MPHIRGCPQGQRANRVGGLHRSEIDEREICRRQPGKSGSSNQDISSHAGECGAIEVQDIRSVGNREKPCANDRIGEVDDAVPRQRYTTHPERIGAGNLIEDRGCSGTAGQCQGSRSEAVGALDRNGGIGHERTPRIAVASGDDGGTASDLGDRAAAPDRVGQRIQVGTVKDERARVGDCHSTRAEGSGGSICADLEDSGGNVGQACVAVGTSQDGGSASDLTERTRSTDRVGNKIAVSPDEGEERVVADAHHTSTEGATGCNLQDSVGDDGSARIGVGIGQDHGSRTDLIKGPVATDHPTVGEDVGSHVKGGR